MCAFVANLKSLTEPVCAFVGHLYCFQSACFGRMFILLAVWMLLRASVMLVVWILL